MKQATLDTCVQDAQNERIVITCSGVPIALTVGFEGMDEEQVQLGSNWWVKTAQPTLQG